MSAEALSKIPLLAVSSICNHIFLPPPNPPPPKEEQAKYTADIPITDRGFTILHGAVIVQVCCVYRSPLRLCGTSIDTYTFLQKITHLVNGLEALLILLSTARTPPTLLPSPLLPLPRNLFLEIIADMWVVA